MPYYAVFIMLMYFSLFIIIAGFLFDTLTLEIVKGALGLALLLALTPAFALAKTITVDAAKYDVEEGGWYDTKEEVAIYLTFFEELPNNYLTKKEAQNLGWESRKGFSAGSLMVSPSFSPMKVENW